MNVMTAEMTYEEFVDRRHWESELSGGTHYFYGEFGDVTVNIRVWRSPEPMATIECWRGHEGCISDETFEWSGGFYEAPFDLAYDTFKSVLQHS